MEKLLTERLKLKNQAKLSGVDDDEKESIAHKIAKIEDDIGEEAIKENYKDIAEQVNELGGDNINVSGRKKVWDLLKKKFCIGLSPVLTLLGGKECGVGFIGSNLVYLLSLSV